MKSALSAERARKIDDVQRPRAAIEKRFGAIERIAVIGHVLPFSVEQPHGAPF